MSTKTTFKRVALVAVAALGAGVLSVAPANATVSTARTVFVDATVGNGGSTYTSATGTLNGNIGVAVTKNIALTTTTATTEAETISITPVLTSAPAGSTVSVGTAGTAKVGLSSPTDSGDYAASAGATKWTNAVTSGVNTLAWSSGTVPAQAATVASVLSLTADVAGTYVVTLNVSSTTGTGTNTSAVVTFYIADLYATTADGLTSGTQSKLTANAVAGANNSVTLTFRTTASESRVLSVSGAGAILTSVGAPTAGTSVIATDKLSAVITDDGTAENVSVVISTPTAGTITASVFKPSQAGIYSTTAYGTVTITVNAAALAGGVDAAKSTSVIKSGATWAAGSSATTDDTVVVSRTASSTVRASVKVSLAQVAGAISGTTKVTVSVAGPGTIVLNDENDASTSPIASGRSVESTRATTTETFHVSVLSDGVSGVGTITITAGTFTATETVTFHGSAASYVVTAKNAYLAVGVTDAQILTISALDSAGVAVPSSTAFVSSSSTSTATLPVTSVTTNADATAVDLGATAVAAGTATITIANAASAPTVSTTYTLNVVKTGIASVALSFDKAEYTAGEKAVITVTAKNADAALIGDATYATFFTSTGITSSANLNGYTADASVATTSGVKTYTVYMPLAAGPVTISATLGASVATAIQATVVTAATTVVSDGVAQAAADAAAEATDAANAATDAANAAAEAADAATAAAQDAADAVAALSVSVAAMIDALKKQITALTNLVIKIQKKVKA